ncbi:MAG: extracellular solute-binding protein [Dehalococcoidia bacterium]|nr:extracellular solute-binding protein [Dehalococcoidia bacterium]
MRRFWQSGIALLVALSFLMVVCSPRVVPPPAPVITTPVPTTAPLGVAPSAPRQVDAEWQKVITAAQQEGKLMMYDSTFFAGDKRIAIPRAFKERYGIPMEILVTGGSSATIERLQVEQRMGLYVADVFVAGSLSGPRMISMGLSQEVAKELPVLKDKDVFIMDMVYSPEGEAIVFGYTPMGVAANSKLVQLGEIQSYKDLMKPKYKGKIIMRDPRLGSGGSPLSLGTLRHLKIFDDTFLSTLAQQQGIYMWGGGEQEVAQMVARGEYMVHMGADLYLLYGPLVREGAPVMPVYMQEGTVGMPNIILMSKGANHPNAARLFINWLLSSEGQKVYHEVGATTPMRKDVPDFLPADMKKEPIKKLLPTDWETTQAILKMISDKDFDNIFGKR